MINPIVTDQSWRKLSLTFLPIFLVIILLSGCISTPIPPPPSPTPTPKVSYSLSTNIDPRNSGSIIPNDGTYEAGRTETLTARPNPGYTFDHWGGHASGTGNSVSVTMDCNKSITAYFASIPTLPVNVTINYIGVKCAHGGNVQLVVVVSDGDKIEKHLIPPGEHTFSMSDFDTGTINQRVFHTASAKDNLKVNILAYHRDQSKKDYLDMIQMMEWYYGDGISMLKNLILNMPENDKLIGYYDNTWYPDEDWGIGQYNEVGTDAFQVWFSIWSDAEPAAIAKPSLLPDVKIKNVEVPSTVSLGPVGLKKPDHTLVLENNEDIDIKIDYFGDTPLALGLYKSPVKGTVNVPKRSSKPVVHSFQYTKEGVAKITYTIFYHDIELDKWSGEVTVLP